jgi:hypothetical protein
MARRHISTGNCGCEFLFAIEIEIVQSSRSVVKGTGDVEDVVTEIICADMCV